MISLAGRDILYAWPKFLLTGMGLGLLIGVTLSMAGVYRGMVDDAQALLTHSGADLWIVQKNTQGPYAEASSLKDDTVRSIAGMPGVAVAANVTYFTMQVQRGADEARAMVVGIESNLLAQPGGPLHLLAGRPLTRSHYEAVVDVKTGFMLGDTIRIRRHNYTVVGVTQRMVSSGGDPMVFISLKDAQEAQFLKDNDSIWNDRARSTSNINAAAITSSSHSVNAILVQVQKGFTPAQVAEPIQRWKHLEAYDRVAMEDILVAKLIATSAKQIAMFLVILSVVSAAIVAFIIYTMTMGKIREIAVLKLIGTSNFTIASMILQQALGLGLIGFLVGKLVATLWAPIFPKYVLLLQSDALIGLMVTLLICIVASTLAIRVAIKIDPAEAIGG